jgi:hypothetical protein
MECLTHEARGQARRAGRVVPPPPRHSSLSQTRHQPLQTASETLSFSPSFMTAERERTSRQVKKNEGRTLQPCPTRGWLLWFSLFRLPLGYLYIPPARLYQNRRRYVYTHSSYEQAGTSVVGRCSFPDARAASFEPSARLETSQSTFQPRSVSQFGGFLAFLYGALDG